MGGTCAHRPTGIVDGMGAVGAGAHASHEHIVRDRVIERVTLLAAMIATV